MRPIFVVIPQPVRDGLTRLTPILEFVQIDTLVFERAPQTLDEDVVPPSALAVHGDLYLGLLEDLDKIAARKLAALVGVEDLRSAVALQRLLQSLLNSWGQVKANLNSN